MCKVQKIIGVGFWRLCLFIPFIVNAMIPEAWQREAMHFGYELAIIVPDALGMVGVTIFATVDFIYSCVLIIRRNLALHAWVFRFCNSTGIFVCYWYAGFYTVR